jgi:hypothetical protein
MTKGTRCPPELRERAMRMAREHRKEHASEWGVIQMIACTRPTRSGRSSIARTPIAVSAVRPPCLSSSRGYDSSTAAVGTGITEQMI